MKAVRILSRNIRDAFKSVFRNFSLSLASISCITITLLVVALSLILTYNVKNFTEKVEKNATIVAFLDVDITSEEKQEVKKQIESISNVDTIDYESKTQIQEKMMAESETYKNIMSEWTEEDSPLQDTYLIKVKDVEQIGETATSIEKIEGVGTVKYGEGMIEQLVTIFDLVRKASYIMVIALVIVTAFLISNTIKITIFSRRREIEIMRLVGASNLNIKIPFVIEGLFLGILGSIIPILVAAYGYVALYDKFDGKLFSSLITLISPQPFIYEVALVLLVIGIVVGMFGSLRAVKKYLKV
jgi:cell division transport system permease protein